MHCAILVLNNSDQIYLPVRGAAPLNGEPRFFDVLKKKQCRKINISPLCLCAAIVSAGAEIFTKAHPVGVEKPYAVAMPDGVCWN